MILRQQIQAVLLAIVKDAFNLRRFKKHIAFFWFIKKRKLSKSICLWKVLIRFSFEIGV